MRLNAWNRPSGVDHSRRLHKHSVLNHVDGRSIDQTATAAEPGGAISPHEGSGLQSTDEGGEGEGRGQGGASQSHEKKGHRVCDGAG